MPKIYDSETKERVMPVQVVDGSGSQIASFGGGTQYTEGDTDASITGTAMLWEDTADTLRSVSASKPLPVNVVTGGTSPATTGTVTSTADAGTSATLLSSDTSRRGFRIYNDSDQGVYVKYGTTASNTDFTVYIGPYGFFAEDNYSGRVDAIWVANSTGSARVTSLS